MSQRSTIAWGITSCIALAMGILAALSHFDIQYHILRLFEWIDGMGVWGPVLFISIYTLIVVLVLPGILFTMGAGFLFGVIDGSIYVVIGNTLGAIVAFMIARHFLGKRASHFLLRQPRLKALNEELMPEGWKIVLVTRMLPFFPFKLSNYFFGLTHISLKGFVSGHLIGSWPLTINIVYIGSLGADLAKLGIPGVARSPVEWTIYATGFIVAALTGIYFARRAQQVLENITTPAPGQVLLPKATPDTCSSHADNPLS
jgi:uncharacterized membrane protein YdjX (TVP38/TMEM64 family)